MTAFVPADVQPPTTKTLWDLDDFASAFQSHILAPRRSCFSVIYKQTENKPDIPKCVSVLCLATFADAYQ